jgi:hypothetical protein
MDADLHSSTIYALTQLDPFLPGAIVIFDEWANPLHEFRALHDYCSAYRRDYEVLAVWRDVRKAALRIKASPAAGERQNRTAPEDLSPQCRRSWTAVTASAGLDTRSLGRVPAGRGRRPLMGL